MRFSRSRVLLVAALIAVAVILAIAMLRHRTAPAHASRNVQQVSRDANGNLVVADGSPILGALTVAPVRAITLSPMTHVPGVVASEPSRSISILTPVAGHVVSVDTSPGQRVARGQVLAILASGDLAQAYADRQKAIAAQTLAQKAFARAQGVLAIGGNAVKDLDSARNDLAQAQAEATRADQRLTALNARAPYSGQGLVPLISPVDGMVATVTIAPGNMVTDPTAVLMTIVDLREVWVNALVPEDLAAAVMPGQAASVTLTADPDFPHAGRVVSVDPLLQPDSRRLQAHVAVDNPAGLLRPNMFADVALKSPGVDNIMVPQSALLMFNDAVNVFVEVAPRVFRRQRIDISYGEGDDVRVLSGLKADARIVTIGGILLNDD